MTKKAMAHSEEQPLTAVPLEDILKKSRPEIYQPRINKVMNLYYKLYDDTPTMPDKVVLQLALWDYFAKELAEQGAEYLVGCVNAVLSRYFGKQLANTDIVDTVTRH